MIEQHVIASVAAQVFDFQLPWNDKLRSHRNLECVIGCLYDRIVRHYPGAGDRLIEFVERHEHWPWLCVDPLSELLPICAKKPIDTGKLKVKHMQPGGMHPRFGVDARYRRCVFTRYEDQYQDCHSRNKS